MQNSMRYWARDGGGWLGAYNVNYLSPADQRRFNDEWLPAIDKAARLLGPLLGRPLVNALSSQGVKPGNGAPIVILPTGALGLLPLGLARDVSTPSLMENYTVALLPSLAALASAKGRGTELGQSTLAAVVNPTGDLPFTVVEGALVESHFASGRKFVVREGAATTSAVIAALRGRDYWHFASHGTFDWEDGRASALLMNQYTPLTVGGLLDSDGLGRPRLVVLSACETGLYDIATTPNEFIGLPAAFLQLGARGVLATL